MTSAGPALRRQIDLPAGVAAWVLSAHAIALATPFVLIAVGWHRRDTLVRVLDHPSLLFIAAGLLLAGSVFEAAQNTEDRWYYTGPRPALSDAAFTLLITAGLGALALCAAGDETWPWLVTAAGLAGVVGLYQRGLPGFPALGLVGLAATGALLQALDQPVILLLLLATGFLNAYFLDGVTTSLAQSLHGAIALSNGLGLLVVSYALHSAAAGARMGWAPVLGIAAVVIAVAGAAWPAMRRLHPTARPSERSLVAAAGLVSPDR